MVQVGSERAIRRRAGMPDRGIALSQNRRMESRTALPVDRLYDGVVKNESRIFAIELDPFQMEGAVG